MHTHIHCRRFSFSLLREGRLCFVAPVPGGDPMEVRTKESSATADFMERNNLLFLGMGDTMSALYRKAVVDNVPENELQSMLQQTETFLKERPQMRNVFRNLKLLNLETAKNIIDQRQWVEAFSDSKNITDPQQQQPEADETPFGPKALLLTLQPGERAMLYREFVGKIIPKAIQEEHREFFDAAPNGQFAAPAVVNKTLKGILGMDDLKSDAPENLNASIIARKSLQDRYYKTKTVDASGQVIEAVGYSKAVTDDYREAVRFHHLAGRHPNPIDSGALIGGEPYDPKDPTKMGLPASEFRGALNLGIIKPNQLEQLGANLQRIEGDYDKVRVNMPRRREELLRTMQSEREKQGKGLMDMWYGSSTLEKLAIIAGALYVIPKAPDMSIMAGGAYFVTKFFYKEDPLKLLSSKTEKVRGWIDGKENMTLDQAQLYYSLIPPSTQGKMEAEALALASVAKLDMVDLVSNLRDNKCTNGNVLVSVENPNFRSAIQKKYGEAAPRILAHVEDNQEALNTALQFVFFNLAKRDTGNGALVRQVEAAVAKLPSGSTVRDLPRLNPPAAALYGTLVAKGALMAGGDSGYGKRSLGSVLTELSVVNPSEFIGTAIAPEKMDTAFEDNAKMIREWSFEGVPAGLTVVKVGDEVSIAKEVVAGGKPPRRYELKMPFAEFKTLNPLDVINLWAKKALEAKQNEYKTYADSVSLQLAQRVAMSFEGELVKLQINNMAEPKFHANASINELIGKTGEEIHKSVFDWVEKVKRVPDYKNKNPFTL